MDIGSLPLRIASKIKPDENGCWLWTAALDPGGYGRVARGGGAHSGTAFAHRHVYLLLVGDPGSLDLDHLCRVHRCVNPEHLEAVPHAVNVQRGISAAATRAYYSNRPCPQGHPLSGANLYVYHDVKRNYVNKQCRMCRTVRARESRARKRAQASSGG